MELKDAIPGRKVIYTPPGNYVGKKLEEGVITSVNHRCVFVRYGSELQSKATSPEDLEYVTTPTGRIPGEPNTQHITIRTEQGDAIRRLFLE